MLTRLRFTERSRSWLEELAQAVNAYAVGCICFFGLEWIRGLHNVASLFNLCLAGLGTHPAR